MPVASVYLPLDLAIIAIIGFLVSVSFPGGLIRFFFLAASAFILGLAISGVANPEAMDSFGRLLGIDIFASKPWINSAIETSAELLRDYLRPTILLGLGLALLVALFATIAHAAEYPWQDWSRGLAWASLFAAIIAFVVVTGLGVGFGGVRQQIAFFGKAVPEDTKAAWTFAAVDGDTLRAYGGRLFRQDDNAALPHALVRLDGIDAPELDQKCYTNGQYTDCGTEAREFLADLMNEKLLLCARNGTSPDDPYHRPIATCWIAAGPAEGTDLAEEVVKAGHAVLYGDRYKEAIKIAQASGRGIWKDGGCILDPKLWREDAAAREAFLAAPPVAGAVGIVCGSAGTPAGGESGEETS